MVSSEGVVDRFCLFCNEFVPNVLRWSYEEIQVGRKGTVFICGLCLKAVIKDRLAEFLKIAEEEAREEDAVDSD